VYAFGHYRNGILYAPATASIVGSLIRRPSEEFSDPAFSPMLFEGRASNRGLATHV
jgi:glycine/D-amino acid oxidase-like deaminating enzyme